MSELPAKWVACAQKVAENPDDFSAWVQLVDATEGLPTTDPRTPKTISKSSPESYRRTVLAVYKNILSQYPYCEQFWVNYANWTFLLDSDVEQTRQIYTKALAWLPKSIVVWNNYLEFVVNNVLDPVKVIQQMDIARQQIGSHFYAHLIYDRYLSYLKSLEMTKDYIYLLRRILEQPIYHYTKYFQEWFKLIEDADLSTIKLIISREELKQAYNMTYADLLSHNSKTDPVTEKFGRLKKNLKHRFSDLFVATQYRVWQIWTFERDIKKPFYVPHKKLSESLLGTWNSYLDYLETDALQATDLNLAMLETVYQRCLIQTPEYPQFWLKYADSKLNRHLIDEAKQVLVEGLYLCDSWPLRQRLVDLEIISGDASAARDLLTEVLGKDDSLPVTAKLLQVENVMGHDPVELAEIKLDDDRYDALFGELLGYSDVPLTKLAKLFKKHHSKRSKEYLTALKDFYKYYQQDDDAYAKAEKLFNDNC